MRLAAHVAFKQFYAGKLKIREHVRDEGIDGIIILKRTLTKCELDSSAQDEVQWRAFVGTVTNFQFS
jgi:hypothetical protein